MVGRQVHHQHFRLVPAPSICHIHSPSTPTMAGDEVERIAQMYYF
jgi:hypothetical protein